MKNSLRVLNRELGADFPVEAFAHVAFFDREREWVEMRLRAERPCTVLFVTHSISEAVLLSDRVVVLTPRPGQIAAVLEIDLPRPRPEEIEGEPEFLDYTRRLRALLREHSLV